MRLPRSATIAYNKAESRMNWDEVAFDGKSGEDCRVKWQQLSANVRNFRTIAEMLVDAERWLESKPRKAKLALTDHPDKPTRPPSIFIRYMMGEMPKLKAKYPNMAHKDVVRKIGEMYKKLTPSKVDRLKEDWHRDNGEYLVRLEQFYADHPEAAPYIRASSTALGGHRSGTGTAFMQFITDKIGDPKFTNLTKEELRAKWAKLKDEKKIAYIEAALDVNRQKETQGSILVPKEKCDVLSKDERELYDRFLGKPTRPPGTGFALFKSIASVELKDLPTAERNKEFQGRWALMSRAEQNKFHNEVKLMKQTFDNDMTEYLKRLKQREQHLIQNGPGVDIKMPSINGQLALSPQKRPRVAFTEHSHETAPVVAVKTSPTKSSSPEKSEKSASGGKLKANELYSDSEEVDVLDAPPTSKQKTVNKGHVSPSVKVSSLTKDPYTSPTKRKFGMSNAAENSPTKGRLKITALTCYQESELEKWREVNPDLSDRELMKSIAGVFEELNEKKKAKWERKAEKKRQRMISGDDD